jgi:uncharacterized protein YqcC (DUF446 family)
MSQPLNETKEILAKITQKIKDGSHQEKEALLDQLKNIDRLVTQNVNKIWLRTKSGKPMAEEVQQKAETALKQLEDIPALKSAINELEGLAKEIDEESQRRSMIVT